MTSRRTTTWVVVMAFPATQGAVGAGLTLADAIAGATLPGHRRASIPAVPGPLPEGASR